jgi:hypothetical protein
MICSTWFKVQYNDRTESRTFAYIWAIYMLTWIIICSIECVCRCYCYPEIGNLIPVSDFVYSYGGMIMDL